MDTIQVQGCDGVVIEVEYPVVAMCGTIKTMLDDLGQREEDDDDEVIPLPIHSDLIYKIFQWCKYHIDDPPPPNEDEHIDIFRTTVCGWDQEFLDVGPEMLLRIIKSASFLNIKGLLYMAAKTLASLVTDKNADEIRDMLNIKQLELPGPSEEKPESSHFCKPR